MNKNYIVILGLLSLLILSGCSQTNYVCSTGEIVESSSNCPEVCGNDICTHEESQNNCAIDCDIETRKGKLPNCKTGIMRDGECKWANVPQDN